MSPLAIALVGCGRRVQRVYFPALPRLGEWLRVIAVCDPRAENRAPAMAHFGVPGFESLAELLKARPMEAALVAAPPSARHALSCLLSAHGVHHLVEAPMCDLLSQARDMVERAARHGVNLRVAEPAWRRPLDLLARRLMAAGVVGRVGRITHFQAQLGYHNNARHQMMTGGAPLAVNALECRMDTALYINAECRRCGETFRNRSFHFPGGLLVTDLAADSQGALGRYDRPGLMEIAGTHGTIVQEAAGHWTGRAEVRLVPVERLTDGSGAYSEGYPVLYRYRDEDGEIEERALHGRADGLIYLGAHVELPHGRFEVENEFAALGLATTAQAAFAAVARDFALLVRAGRPDPFPPETAIASLTMELAAELSARRAGARVALGDPELAALDAGRLEALRGQLGFDLLDIESAAAHVFPEP